MDELSIRSTSRSSAEVSDIPLRETATTRLVFRPMLVDNTANPAAAAKGTFVFQRKSTKGSWDDVPAEPLSNLKKDDAYKLHLDSGETLKLFTRLSDLYRIHAKEGIPRGDTRFVRAHSALAAFRELTEAQLRAFLEANAAVGSPLITRLLSWAADARDVSQLVDLLEGLGPGALANLNAAVSVSSLAEGLALWNTHRSNADEEFWQRLLSSRSFLLEQLFSWPCTVIQEKAYVGGKSVHNTGGHLVDFLVKNRLTTSAGLVEIKTPMTPLTGKEYRAGIPNISGALAGSVVQALSYKASLCEHYRALGGATDQFEVFDPPCAVIVGNAQELSTGEQRRTFELFRGQLGGLHIITFDELFGRVERLIELLKGGASGPHK